MGINKNPSTDTPLFNITARPNEHDAVIGRQGQWVRFLHRKICTCVKNGETDMYCKTCNGRGETYYFQSEKQVAEEDSPHFGQNVIYPYWHPITKVIKVQRKLAEIQGGNVNYQVKNFTDKEIYITGSPTPKHYEMIQCTYKFFNLNEKELNIIYVLNENKFEIDLPIDIQNARSNYYGVKNSIAKVVEFTNITKEESYLDNITYAKQHIYLDTTGLTNLEDGDVFYIKLQYAEPEYLATQQLRMDKMLEKWGSDIETGDVDATVPSMVDIKEGDLVTFLISAQTSDFLMKRTRKEYDEIPEFDVIEILENIKDEDEVEYIKDTDFEIREYNNLFWKGNTPAVGKKYNIVFTYKLTYRVFRGNIRHITNENQRFPKNVLLRKYNRVINKEPLVVQ